MKNLVIKGHQTRGSEVIEILKMLGGKNSAKLVGSASSCGYYIDSDGNIAYHYYFSSYFNDAIQFTLEEFFEKYPYKVGDRVQSKGSALDSEIYIIKSMEWNNFIGQIYYTIKTINGIVNQYKWIAQEFMFHKEETTEEKNNNNWAKWDLPDGYEFQDKDGNIINTSVIRLVKKQPQYPKTYEECCEVLNLTKYPPALVPNKTAYINQYEDFPYYYEIQKLAELTVCRNAYWKIAGDQMGLDEPWKPDWTKDTEKYVIYPYKYLYSIDVENYRNTLLAFPTAEMRDAFYDNFKESIEICKELL